MAEENDTQPILFLDLATDLLAAYVSNNALPASELPGLLNAVHNQYMAIAGSGGVVVPSDAVRGQQAVQMASFATEDRVRSTDPAAPQQEVAREAPPKDAPLKPAVAIKDSVSDDFIVCLEDGRSFKTLKRHLAKKYDMTPEQYRAKWGLAPDYPMVAKNYSEQRSKLAHQLGLGQKTGQAKK